MSRTSYIMDQDRVLVIPGWYPSSIEPYNGDFIQEQVTILRQAGFKIDVIYSDLNIAYLQKGLSSSRTSIRTHACGDLEAILSGPFWPKNQSLGLERWVKKSAGFIKGVLSTYREANLPKVIHAHTYLGGAVAQIVSKDFHIPYIITEHYTGWLDGSIPAHHKSLGKEALRSAAVVTAVSPALSQVLSKELEQEVLPLPNLIDTSFFTMSASRPDDIFRFVGAGDLIPRKNWNDCIIAFAHLVKTLPSCEVVIAGEGDERLKLEKSIRALNLEGKVKLPGHLNRQGILDLYKCSHVLLHTSHTETFGLTQAEAMSCGLPVISYAHPAADYVIANKDLGVIVKENTPYALSEQMERVKRNYSQYNSTLIRKSVVDRFGIENYKRELATIYSGLFPG